MTKRSKSYEQAAALIDRDKLYTPVEAVKLAKQTSTTKRFDSTVEVAMRLGVDPRKADQMVRGTVSLPHTRSPDRAVARLGFQPDGEVDYGGVGFRQYRLTRAAWAAARA